MILFIAILFSILILVLAGTWTLPWWLTMLITVLAVLSWEMYVDRRN